MTARNSNKVGEDYAIIKPEDLKILSLDGTDNSPQQLDPFVFNWKNNDNWRARCGCDQVGSCTTKSGGKSYIKFHNRRSAYDLKIVLVHFIRTTWEGIEARPRKYRFTVKSGKNGGGYISNFYATSTYTLQGTFGFEFYHKGTDNLAFRYIYNPEGERSGINWWQCGKDYYMYFND